MTADRAPRRPIPGRTTPSWARGYNWFVPEISRFLGIVIGMFYKDHNPPHFHAYYGDAEVAISISDGAVLWGSLPRRALAHVLEWRQTHAVELLEDWERARQHQPLKPIEPLE